MAQLAKVVKCCSPNCKKKIRFNNKTQFESHRDKNRGTIQYYCPNEYVSEQYKRNYFKSVYGVKVRIYCDYCFRHNKLNKCGVSGCNNYDRRSDICFNHPPCKYCKSLKIIINCEICNEPFCERFYCINMPWKYKDSLKCKECLIQSDIDKLSHIIMNVLPIFNQNITDILANFAIGYISNCCNDVPIKHIINVICDREIAFDNKIQYELQIDYQQKQIYSYQPKYFPEIRKHIFFKGNKCRIFCGRCTEKYRKNCAYNLSDRCYGRDTHIHCGNHLICNEHNIAIVYDNLIFCAQCKMRFCKLCSYKIESDNDNDHIFYCGKECIMKDEYNKLKTIISNILNQSWIDLEFEENIINNITEFGIGKIFQCTNTYDECTKEIMFESIFDFQQKLDWNGNQIYYYFMDLVVSLLSHRQHNDQYRMFCVECSSYRLHKWESERNIDYKIGKIINKYAVGFVFDCGNMEDKCVNEIAFDDMKQIKGKRDYKMQKIYYYKPLFQKLNKPTIFINDNKFRIFCFECAANKLKKCKMDNKCNKESGGTECGNHAICKQCNNVISTEQTFLLCNICNKHFCKKCSCCNNGRFYCRKCLTKKELGDLVDIIWSLIELFQTDIANKNIALILAKYSVGYIFQCCNEYDECNQEITVDNIWKFRKKKNGIYYYAPKYFADDKPVINVNNKLYRIFCRDCN
eukprot:259947_1